MKKKLDHIKDLGEFHHIVCLNDHSFFVDYTHIIFVLLYHI